MARHLLMFTIGLTFSIALPLILLFSCLYWAAGYLFTKYNLLYVHIAESEGINVVAAHNIIVFVVYHSIVVRKWLCFQCNVYSFICRIGYISNCLVTILLDCSIIWLTNIISIGIFGSKSAAVQAPFVLLLLPITYFMFTFTTDTFRRPAKYLNMMESRDVSVLLLLLLLLLLFCKLSMLRFFFVSIVGRWSFRRIISSFLHQSVNARRQESEGNFERLER
jgi:hypothetical protein